MKLGGAVMGRNEIDIIGTFLRHLDTLFDYVLVMDHGLLDGTDRIIAEACARRPGRTMWRVEAVSYHQSEFSTFALRHLLQATDADFVVLLDADEFIDTLDRASFEAALAAAADPDCVGVLHWLNAVPCRFDSRAIDPGEAIWVAKAPGPLGKVAISRAFCDRHGNEGRLGVGEPCARV
jgi:Glycosyl transferase family 2